MKYFLIATVLVLTVINPAFAGLVQETCAKIAKSDPKVNVNFCISALNGDPSGRMAVSIEQLGFTSLKLGIANAINVGLSGAVLESTSTLQKAVRDIKARDYMKANLDVLAAMDNYHTCENQFGERRWETSSLTEENAQSYQLAAISLSITNMLRL
ncbi:hypothetical protein Droror1_Dr00025495 [Drosera rotundifolia]